MRNRLGIALVITGLVLSLGVVLGLKFVGDGVRTRTLTGVTSTGSAVKAATADIAVWSLTITARDPAAAKAARSVATALPRVRAYFEAAGLADPQFSVGSLNTYSTEDGSGRSMTEASLSFSVRTTDVAKIAELNASVMDLLAVAPGVNLNTSPPSYYLSKLDTLRPWVQQSAVLDARQRAQVMAEALGVELGDPITVRVSSITVTPPDVIEGEYGGYDLSTIDKSVRAVVSVTFALR